MREYYLSVLGLSGTPTEEELRSAYRRLSKQFHPDINKAPDATGKFLAIKEAYEYLSQSPGEEEVYTHSYEETISDEELWRRQYRQWQYQKEQEKRQQQEELIRSMMRYARPVVWVILIFNSLLLLDYLLPLQHHEEWVTGTGTFTEKSRGRTYAAYDVVYFENYEMIFKSLDEGGIENDRPSIVQTTSILSIPLYAVLTIRGEEMRYRQVFNIYFVFGILIPAMIVLGYFFIRSRRPMTQLNLSMSMILPAAIQLVLFIWF
jgi:curved DNA-binding protein CbpA